MTDTAQSLDAAKLQQLAITLTSDEVDYIDTRKAEAAVTDGLLARAHLLFPGVTVSDLLTALRQYQISVVEHHASSSWWQSIAFYVADQCTPDLGGESPEPSNTPESSDGAAVGEHNESNLKTPTSEVL